MSIDELLDGQPGLSDRPGVRTDALQAIARAAHTRSGEAADESPALPELDGYDVIDEIGRGGMGVVYEAYQQSTGRRVALKFLSPAAAGTEAARRRFEREVELVARLEHPDIVSVLDSGVHRGRYYYAMDYIEGRPLDDAFRPGGCEVEEVLHLLARVSETVDYAHQRGVLHRDLKPSNILVDAKGQPHLLDFGLAKAIDAVSCRGAAELTLSEPGQLLGTLAYMSPEQSRGHADEMSVRSDVYSIGAIAYELITGALPCRVDGALGDVLARVANQDPVRPSALRRRLSPDVDAMLLKALEKSPAARYATAGELAADMRRYLAHQTIVARPVGWLGRTVRWTRRNRAVASVGGLAVILIVALTTTSLIRIARERDRARTEAAKAQQINSFLLDLFASVDPFTAKGPEVTVRELLDEAARRLDSGLASQPEVQAALAYTIAGSYHNLGLSSAAVPLLRQAVETRRRLLGPEHPDVAEALVGLGLVLDQQGDCGAAEDNLREALRIRRQALGDHAPPVAEALNKLGQVLRHRHDYAGSEQAFRQALAIRRTGSGDANQVDIAFTLYHLGLTLLEQRQYDAAGQAAVEALEIFGGHLGAEHPLCAAALSVQGRALAGLGDAPSGERLLREAVAVMRRRVGDEHPRLATLLADLATLQLETGNGAAAQAPAREALAIRQKRLPAGHPDLVQSEELLRRVLQESGPAPVEAVRPKPSAGSGPDGGVP